MQKEPRFVLWKAFKQSFAERRVVFLLAFIVIALSVFPFIYDSYIAPEPKLIVVQDEVNQLQIIEQKEKYRSHNFNMQKPISTSKLNLATWHDLVNVGISKKTANNILAFRKSIGSFSSWEQVSKTYGLNKKDLSRLKSNFNIPYSKRSYIAPTEESDIIAKKIETSKIIDINTVSKEALIEIKGIGPYYANKLISYRNLLGGFHSSEQILETFGIPDSVKQSLLQFLVFEGDIKKIEINNLNLEELAKHPYISYKEAKRIVNYRNQHGEIADTEELEVAARFGREQIIKIAPYLQF